jgi:hypothetical protein
MFDEGAQCGFSFCHEVGMSQHIDFRQVAQDLLFSHPSSNLYFLLDAAGLPGLHRQLLQTSVEWSSLFDCTRESNALQVAPFLVLAGSDGRLLMSRSLFNWIGEHGAYSSSVVMLSSPLGMASLQIRLAARLEVRLSENMDAMLRFFDPRVLESLTKILPSEQAKIFFGAAECWRYIDRTGKLVSVATAFDINENFVAPLLLGKREEFELIEACDIDQVLRLLRENLPRLTATLSPPDQAVLVERAIGTARKQGLNSVYKFSLYAAALLSQGERFAGSPQSACLIEELKRDDFDADRMNIFDLDEEGMQA